MGVKAGDFYVNLGIKGSDKANNDLKKTTDSFKDLKEGAIEAKVAFLAVFAVLSKIVMASTGLAQTLKNLSSITGISTRTYQEVALAGRPYGVETTTSQNYLNKIQEAFVGMKAGEDAPPWLLATFSQLRKRGIKAEGSVDYYSSHPEAFLQLQEKFANLPGLSKSESRYILEKQGVPDEIIAAMHAGAYGNLDRYAGEVLTDKQVEDSAKAREHINALGAKIGSGLDKGVAWAMAPDKDTDARGQRHRDVDRATQNLKRLFSHPIDFFKDDGKSLSPKTHKTVNIHHTSHNTFHTIPEKTAHAARKATSTDHADLVALTKSASQDR